MNQSPQCSAHEWGWYDHADTRKPLMVKTFLYLLPFCLLTQNLPQFNLASPEPASLKVNKSFFRIGDQLMTLEKYGDHKIHNYVIVSLHHDDHILESALSMVQSYQSGFIRLLNKQGRNVEADLFNKKLVFDPNNIFTSWGRREHLKANHCWSKASDEYVQQLARFVLNEIPIDKTVVMFLDEKTNLADYTEGGKKEKQVKNIFQSSAMEATSFFLTTDELIFEKLKSANANAVLQNPKKMEDDGSLPVYCSKANRNYLTVVNGDGIELDLLNTIHFVLK